MDEKTHIFDRQTAGRILSYLGKFILAGIVAVLILSIIFAGYYLVPLRVDNPDKNTDYKWEPNSIWVRMEEGLSVGKYDANGFNNAEVVDNPDVLILGSSHMEAVNVPQHQNTGYYLSQMLNGKLSVYNMGISGHTFAKICQYLPQTMQVYEAAPKYIVLETGGTVISEKESQDIINQTVLKTPVSHNTLLNLLQKSPFFRVMYYQLDGGLIKKLSDSGNVQTANGIKAEKSESNTKEVDKTPYNDVFGYLQMIQEEYNTNIIIMYHPAEKLNSDGTVTYPQDETYIVFSDEAQAHGLTFVDTTDAFITMHKEDYKLPHGFINGKLGEGHLNGNGHYAVAQSLSEAIMNIEEAKDADH